MQKPWQKGMATLNIVNYLHAIEMELEKTWLTLGVVLKLKSTLQKHGRISRHFNKHSNDFPLHCTALNNIT